MHIIDVICVLVIFIGLAMSVTYQSSLMWRQSETIELIEKGEYVYNQRKSEVHRGFKTSANTAIYETDDLEYVQTITIGIPPRQQFTVWLKLIASEMYVPHKNCSTGGCLGKRKFEPEKSATFIDYSMEPKWKLTIDGIESSGYYGGDVIKIGTSEKERLNVPNMKFGLATNILYYKVVKTEFDGILGLSFSIREPLIKTPQTFIERMIETGIFEKPVFTIWLGPRSKQSGARAGEITYGGTDSTNCGPTLAEIPLCLYTSNEYEIDGVEMGNIMYKKRYYAYHTMDSWIMGPREPVLKMAKLAGAQLAKGVFHISCNATFPVFNIYYGNVTFSIASANLILQLSSDRCILGLLPINTGDSNYWTFGAPFHREYCTTFDVGLKRLLLSKIIPEDKKSTTVSSRNLTTTLSLSTPTSVRSSSIDRVTSTSSFASTAKSSTSGFACHYCHIIAFMLAFMFSSTVL